MNKIIYYDNVNWYFVLIPINIEMSKARREDIKLLHVFDKEGFIDGLLPEINMKASRAGKKIGTAFMKEYLTLNEKKMSILDLCLKKLREDNE